MKIVSGLSLVLVLFAAVNVFAYPLCNGENPPAFCHGLQPTPQNPVLTTVTVYGTSYYNRIDLSTSPELARAQAQNEAQSKAIRSCAAMGSNVKAVRASKWREDDRGWGSYHEVYEQADFKCR